MIYIENDIKDAAFHFSVEEHFTRGKQLDVPVLMLWSVDNCVMIGNNQVLTSEINMDYALENDVKIVRRSSGGGAIFTDSGTLLYTMIEPYTDDASAHMENTASIIIEVLSLMGVDSKREGRNDILIAGKKISGLAQFISGSHICTHGSLLYDADLDALTNVLKPNDDKLLPKGISSIRSRVTNIKPHMDASLSVAEFKKRLKQKLLDGKDFIVYEFSSEDLSRIERIHHKKFANKAWNLRM